MIYILIFILIVIILSFYLYKKNNYPVYLVSFEKDKHIYTKNIPVYVVSMEKDKHRREYLYKKIIPEMHVGIDGNNLKIYKNLNKIDLKLGEIGCYLSHYFLLSHIAKKDDDYAIILEDDIEYKDYDILKLIDTLPNDWDILCLSHNYYTENNINKRKYTNNSILKNINYLHGAQAYLVKTSSIKSKLNKLFPIKNPYDLILPEIFNTYIIEPKIMELSHFRNYSNTQNIN